MAGCHGAAEVGAVSTRGKKEEAARQDEEIKLFLRPNYCESRIDHVDFNLYHPPRRGAGIHLLADLIEATAG